MTIFIRKKLVIMIILVIQYSNGKNIVYTEYTDRIVLSQNYEFDHLLSRNAPHFSERPCSANSGRKRTQRNAVLGVVCNKQHASNKAAASPKTSVLQNM